MLVPHDGAVIFNRQLNLTENAGSWSHDLACGIAGSLLAGASDDADFGVCSCTCVSCICFHHGDRPRYAQRDSGQVSFMLVRSPLHRHADRRIRSVVRVVLEKVSGSS